MIRISVLVSLYRCQIFIKPFLEHCIKTTGLDQIEFLLLHNDPLPSEVDLIKPFLADFPHVVYEQIQKREGLYSTWNRGIQMAKGEYITVWNVDDVRFPDSILNQAKTLDEHPDAAMAYGDIYCSEIYAEKGKKRTNSPEWKKGDTDFYKAYHMSCFQMWRKEIHNTIGYYDEQFKCSADLDFQIRTALHLPLIKTPSVLGVYLERQPHKLSSNGLQRYENNIIYLRYGAYENLDLSTVIRSVNLYSRNELMFFEKSIPFQEKSPFGLAHKAKGLIIAAYHFPLSLAKLTVKKLLRSVRPLITPK